MEITLVRGSHCVGESNLHLQFTPAYRRDVFGDELVRILTRDYMLSAARMHGLEITAMGFGDEHAHIFMSNWKNFSIARIVQLLKGFSSRMMRKNHQELFKNKLYGKKFWSAGYFYRTVGVVNASTVRIYVEESQKYSFRKSGRPNQPSLIEFSA